MEGYVSVATRHGRTGWVGTTTAITSSAEIGSSTWGRGGAVMFVGAFPSGDDVRETECLLVNPFVLLTREQHLDEYWIELIERG
jgi:hypothetical protein